MAFYLWLGTLYPIEHLRSLSNPYINYSKTKARNRRVEVNELEESLQNCTRKCGKDPSRQNVEDLECLQVEYDQLYDYITQGAIVRSRATWYEKGEKNNKYFLNLEKSNKEKVVYVRF